LLDRIYSDKDQARLLALQEKESGAWLHALPFTSLGTLLDNNQSFRISICLRLVILMCVPHPCTCGEIVNKLGPHEMIKDLVKHLLKFLRYEN
jgi:hypothetical protein